MYLKNLTIRGFKTFADKTEIEFDPLGSITAIVGPNGCGKSNVLDAVRWVLGEQSPKSLRTDALGEVIFAGTANRRAISLAEVSLLFENDDHLLPVDYHEVEIKRRTFRDSESEFFINRNNCRLKDIRDLFLDSGLGAGSYAIISQGQVDAILSSKPEDRRAVFEEAAGVNKYRNRKEAALKRLIITEQNLLRLKDLTTEISDQMKVLAEQAEKARAYQEIKDKLKDAELSYYKKVLGTYVEKRTELENRQVEIRASSDQMLQEAQDRDLKRESIRAEIREIEKQEREVRSQLVGGTKEEELRVQVLEIEGQLSEKRNLLRDLESRSHFLSFENERNHKRAEQLERRKLELAEKVGQINQEVSAIKQKLEHSASLASSGEEKDQLVAILELFAASETDLVRLALELDAAPSPERSAELAKTARQIADTLKKLNSQIKIKFSSQDEAKDDGQETVEDWKLALATSGIKLEAAEKEMNDAGEELEQLAKSSEQHRNQIQEIEGKKQALQAEISAVEEGGKALSGQLNDSRLNVAGSLEALIQKREDLERQLEELERGLSQATLDEQRKMGELNRIEVNLAKLEAEVAGVKERLKEDYNMEEQELLQTAYEPRGGQVRTEISDYRLQIQNMGPVNPLAIEEYQKGTDRLAFMERQVNDLNSSQENLKTLIGDLDNLARDNFLKIVEAVSVQFSQIFASLFNGGEAKITLTNPENVLETGVEIYAKPGGRKFLNLSALSGGEKALTAISLLFALLRIHPSPFCFLDEVDAALDDANIDRFTQLLKSFSEKVQIIVVTHSKQTMAAADVIYGVTMEEPGVSKIVSMKMAQVA